jgi:predicted transcriptional regulator
VLDSDFIDTNAEVATIKCNQKDCSILQYSSVNSVEIQMDVSLLEKSVLQKLWSSHYSKGHHLIQILQSFEKWEQKAVSKSISNLGNNGYLDIRGNHVYFNINRILAIKKILKIAL